VKDIGGDKCCELAGVLGEIFPITERLDPRGVKKISCCVDIAGEGVGDN
jgi:hypothetical protein